MKYLKKEIYMSNNVWLQRSERKKFAKDLSEAMTRKKLKNFIITAEDFELKANHMASQSMGCQDVSGPVGPVGSVGPVGDPGPVGLPGVQSIVLGVGLQSPDHSAGFQSFVGAGVQDGSPGNQFSFQPGCFTFTVSAPVYSAADSMISNPDGYNINIGGC
jgi:hypothetical protein